MLCCVSHGSPYGQLQSFGKVGPQVEKVSHFFSVKGRRTGWTQTLQLNSNSLLHVGSEIDATSNKGEAFEGRVEPTAERRGSKRRFTKGRSKTSIMQRARASRGGWQRWGWIDRPMERITRQRGVGEARVKETNEKNFISTSCIALASSE